MPRSSPRNALVYWPVIAVVVVTDIITKAIAENTLMPRGVPHPVWGEGLRLTLVYNPGAAFGLHVGNQSRWVFMALTIAALLILGRLYLASRPGERARVMSLALVCGGAVGNLIDRIRSEKGVIDFLDVGIGDARWPTFNVADMAVSVGAFLLAIVLWAEDRPSEEGAAGVAAVAGAAPVPLVSGEFSHESGEAS